MALPTTQAIAENVRILTHVVQDVCEKKYLKHVVKGKLSNTQFTILQILFNSGPMSVSELANVQHMSRAAASKNVEILYEAKMVSRQVIKSDRRYTMISLLSKGEKLVREYEEIRMNMQCNVLSSFTQDEQYQFAQLLEKYIVNCIDEDASTELVCLQCNGKLGDDCSISKQTGKCHFHIRQKSQKQLTEE